MRLGKVSQSVYQRSIRKQLQPDGTELVKPSQDEHCFGWELDKEVQILNSNVSLYGDEKDLCVFAIAQAVNELAAKGAEVKGLSIDLLLPEYAFESRIKSMLLYAKEAAKEWGIPIFRADAQILAGISTTIVHVTATGVVVEESDKKAVASPGQDLVMIGYAGLEGALRIKRAKEAELAARFPASFLQGLEGLRSKLLAREALQLAGVTGSVRTCPVKEGGVFAALWYLAESADAGLSVELRRILVKQEVIEVCECFQVNPYQLTSTGAVLLAVDQGEAVVQRLEMEGIPAALIGQLTEGNDRVLYSGGEMRYLDKPAPDELTKVLGVC